MKTAVSILLCLLGLATLGAPRALAAATLSQEINPPEVSIGDQVTVTYTIENGTGTIHLPPVSGLQMVGSSSSTRISFNNGSMSSSFSEIFSVVPQQAGDFTIPAFDIQTGDGQALHTQPMKLHVVAGAAPIVAPQQVTPSQPAQPQPAQPQIAPPSGGGPVVMPSTAPSAPAGANPADNTGGTINVPMDPDGRPARVFNIITPQTLDAYVGESVPLRIDTYLRVDSQYSQNSLPTLKGSDFMMNTLSLRPAQDEAIVANEEFVRTTWITAISAPKTGDFPLQIERDTYWTTPSPVDENDPFAFMHQQGNVHHQNIPSNSVIMRVHDLPSEGRPAGFSNAIGKFTATGEAAPTAVAVGEPVTLRFAIVGAGNFDYIKCPALADDPAWKTYAPTSKIDYTEESHTEGVKKFELAIIPQKGGTLPLPAATFSYFDPAAKQYVSLPISLPAITVSGAALPAPALASASPSTASSDANAAPTLTGLFPNRLELGALQPSLTPVYQQPLFWGVQALLLSLTLAGLVVTLRRRPAQPLATDSNALREQMQAEDEALQQALARGDAPAFFLAARRAVQCRLALAWELAPEAITMAEIRRRDPALAAELEPLFTRADEAVYSGAALGPVALAPWETQVHQLLQTPLTR